jgi:hypothetical protein
MTLDTWTRYSDEEVSRLAADAPLIMRRAESRCPVCGQVAVRFYYHESLPPHRPVGFSYGWCSNCHRYTAATVEALSVDFDFDDPPAASDVVTRSRTRELDDPRWLVEQLDKLWDEGVLPQSFTPKRA